MIRPKQRLLAWLIWIDSLYFLPFSLFITILAITGSWVPIWIVVAAFFLAFPSRCFRLRRFASRLSHEAKHIRLSFLYFYWLLMIVSMMSILWRHSPILFGCFLAMFGVAGLCVIAAVRTEILEAPRSHCYASRVNSIPEIWSVESLHEGAAKSKGEQRV